ncbi:MAG: BolA family transcriptional regulator [Alphaproteobacteria bacterium]|nr:BolA family transcriptional regulator [Alphaproteobacteria bacterium]
MNFKLNLEEKLQKAFAPLELKVINNSFKHRHHKTWLLDKNPGQEGESHFYIEMTSSYFEGMSKLERHKAIYDLFKEELKNHIHALELKLKTPNE